jgi:phosphoribosylamine---glycine ligase
VLGVSAFGETIAAARGRSYAAIDRIQWPDGFCRSDIGARAIEHERPHPMPRSS